MTWRFTIWVVAGGLLSGALTAWAVPLVSAASVEQALARRGVVAGAGTTIDGATYVIDKITVRSEGRWVVVRILPRQLR